MVIARLAWNLFVHQPTHDLEVHHPHLRLQQRGLHPLAFTRFFALKQRNQGTNRTEQARCQIRNRDAGTHRTATGLTGYRHDAAQALRDLIQTRPINIRTVLPKARYACQDDARVHFAQ